MPEGLQAMYEACKRDRAASGVRDSAYIALVHGAGLRAADLARLGMRDYDSDAGALRVPLPRGGERRLVLDGDVRQALERWLKLRRRKGGPLFCPVMMGGRIVRGHRLSPMSIHLRIVRRGEEAGLVHVTPNDLRRAHIWDLIRRALNTASVLGLSGDSEVADMIIQAVRTAKGGPATGRNLIDDTAGHGAGDVVGSVE
jgi:integrase